MSILLIAFCFISFHFVSFHAEIVEQPNDASAISDLPEEEEKSIEQCLPLTDYSPGRITISALTFYYPRSGIFISLRFLSLHFMQR